MINKVRKVTPCAWPYCTKEGKFKAPCDPRDLRKRILLCDEHIILYNKQWNGLDGFTAEEIFDMQGNPAWDKPTWKLGEKQQLNEEIFNFTHGADKKVHGHDFFSDETEEMAQRNIHQTLSLPKTIQNAMDILDIEEPLEPAKVKKAYRNKVKENHPDRAADKSKAEEHLKEINDAHQKIISYIKLAK